MFVLVISHNSFSLALLSSNLFFLSTIRLVDLSENLGEELITKLQDTSIT